ncbi:MAG: hypothetical protein ABIE75_03195 [Candidatus Omnitrophota bacterium]
MEKKQVLAFDLGRVLFDFDYSIALAKIKDKISVPVARVIKELFENDFGLSFEKGLVSSRAFHVYFNDTFGASLSYEYFADVWCKIFSPKEEVITLVSALKRAYPLYLISNINQLHFDYLYQTYPQVFGHFRAWILSYKIKSVKPEKAIYQALSDIAATEFENIIYIDDRKDLITKAKDFNLQCLQFTNLNQLLRDLDNLDISLPHLRQ